MRLRMCKKTTSVQKSYKMQIYSVVFIFIFILLQYKC